MTIDTEATDTAAVAEVLAKRKRFDDAFAEWLSARAAIEGAEAGVADVEMDRRTARREAAEVALIMTPATYEAGVFFKFELLEQLVTDDCVNGASYHPLALLALASLKADVIGLGLRRG